MHHDIQRRNRRTRRVQRLLCVFREFCVDRRPVFISLRPQRPLRSMLYQSDALARYAARNENFALVSSTSRITG